MSLLKVTVFSAALAQAVLAVPASDIEERQCTGCTPPATDSYCPVVDQTNSISGDPWQAGASGPGGTTLTFSRSSTKGTSWTVGASLGLTVEDLVSVGLGGEYTESVEYSIAIGTEAECPEGPWQCSVLVYEGLEEVKGHNENIGPIASCAAGLKAEGGDFTALIPRKDQGGNGFYTTELCTCPNGDGVDAEGHPEKICIEDCVLAGFL